MITQRFGGYPCPSMPLYASSNNRQLTAKPDHQLIKPIIYYSLSLFKKQKIKLHTFYFPHKGFDDHNELIGNVLNNQDLIYSYRLNLRAKDEETKITHVIQNTKACVRELGLFNEYTVISYAQHLAAQFRVITF